MKIAVLGFNKIKYMPYLNFYFENLDTEENEVHILYWNRDLKKEVIDKYCSSVLHEFRYYQEDYVSKIFKIRSFLKYRKFAKKIITEEKFDLIIILHSLPGIIISDILSKHYKDKYIFDYRDFTYESFWLYKKIIGNIVKNSRATFVSSDAFRRFLPNGEQYKVFTSHNIILDSLSYNKGCRIPSDKIRISYWGFIRNENVNREIIKKVSRDVRFQLHYYGKEQQLVLKLKEYSKEICATNVFFHGEYKPDDRYGFARNTDIIHNVYEDTNMTYAMSNKYYDALVFGIPIMSLCGSFMEHNMKKAGIGFSVNPYEDDFTDKLFEAYNNLNREAFNRNIEIELRRVLNEYWFGAELISNLTKDVK